MSAGAGFSSLETQILRIAAGVALFGFLLLPQVSCGGMRVSGFDILRVSTQGNVGLNELIMSGLSVVVIGSAGFALLQPSATLGVLGIGALLVLLITVKLNRETGPLISIEPGAFVTTFGFLVLALKQQVNSILGSQVSKSINAAGPRQDHVFCSQCGSKNTPDSAFCSDCGSRII